MELIITENCSLKNKIEPFKDNIYIFFSRLINKINLNTLKKVIITDDDFNNYSRSVKEISKEIDVNVEPSENSVAIVIDGIDIKNEFVQYIFINGCILLLFYMYLCGNIKDDTKGFYKLAYSTVLHEIGHCIYNDILYTKHNYRTPNKWGI